MPYEVQAVYCRSERESARDISAAPPLLRRQRLRVIAVKSNRNIGWTAILISTPNGRLDREEEYRHDLPGCTRRGKGIVMRKEEAKVIAPRTGGSGCR